VLREKLREKKMATMDDFEKLEIEELLLQRRRFFFGQWRALCSARKNR